jgi:hypothetical protein
MPAAWAQMRKAPKVDLPRNRLSPRQLIAFFLIVYFLIFAGNLIGAIVNWPAQRHRGEQHVQRLIPAFVMPT